MTNRDFLINLLKDREMDGITVDYLDCVDIIDCEADRSPDREEWSDDNMGFWPPCTECKKKWLDEEREFDPVKFIEEIGKIHGIGEETIAKIRAYAAKLNGR